MTKQTNKRQEAKTSDEKLQSQVVAAFKEGDKLSDVATKFHITPGKAALIKMQAEVKPKDRIKADNDKDLAKLIVAARKEGASWGLIMARSGLGEGRVRSLYKSGSGKDSKGDRIEGKGGRKSSEETSKTTTKTTTSGTTSKKHSGKKRGGKKGVKANPSTAA